MGLKKVDLLYFSPLVTFRVEDSIFKVPRKEFEEDSEVFANMYSLPSGTTGEGESDENPICLDGVLASDFGSFLQALFRRPVHRDAKPLTEHDLDMALKLAKMWCFNGLQKVLIKDLETLQLPACRKLQLARIYDIREWYISELRILAFRSSDLTLEEAEQLGLDLMVVVSALRNERLQSVLENGMWSRNVSIYGRDIEQNNKCSIEGRVDKKLVQLSQDHNWN